MMLYEIARTSVYAGAQPHEKAVEKTCVYTAFDGSHHVLTYWEVDLPGDVPGLLQFMREIGEDVILSREGVINKSLPRIEIIDSYRE